MNAVSTARRAVSACAATLIVLVALTAAPATAAELPLAYRAWDLPASDPAAGARFGSSVAVWGDTAVVGAPYTSGERGAAYVFMRAGGAWTLRQKLIALDGAETDRFGWSVAIRGDTILIGAA
ncbi:MAG: FG-GAP repeat protein, partial [Coriobacteriia bacterium]|nr:FG-GAP repeat protein [Coriobacteriia bacterium]